MNGPGIGAGVDVFVNLRLYGASDFYGTDFVVPAGVRVLQENFREIKLVPVRLDYEMLPPVVHMFEENDLVSLGFRNIVLRVPVLPPDLDGGDPVAPPAGVEIVDPGDPGPVPPVLDAGFAEVDMGADVGLGVGPYLQGTYPVIPVSGGVPERKLPEIGQVLSVGLHPVFPLAACILEKDNFVLQGIYFLAAGLFISRACASGSARWLALAPSPCTSGSSLFLGPSGRTSAFAPGSPSPGTHLHGGNPVFPPGAVKADDVRASLPVAAEKYAGAPEIDIRAQQDRGVLAYLQRADPVVPCPARGNRHGPEVGAFPVRIGRKNASVEVHVFKNGDLTRSRDDAHPYPDR